jgi:hypothetical protein
VGRRTERSLKPHPLAGPAPSPRLAWTTVTRRQIDLDVHDLQARTYLSAVLRQLAEAGVGMVA